MAKEGIKVSFDEVVALGTKIGTENGLMETELKSVWDVIKNLESCWDSAAFEKLSSDFNAINNQIKNHTEQINAFVTGLNKSKAIYEEGDTIVAKANQILKY